MSNLKRSQRLARLTALALSVQFMLGMVVNTYVAIPRHHPGAGSGGYFSGVAEGVRWAIEHGRWSLALHATFGLLLILAAVATLGSAIRNRERDSIVSATAGTLLIIGAGFNGASFLNYGHALSSLLMATFFLLALIIYLVGFTRRAPREIC